MKIGSKLVLTFGLLLVLIMAEASLAWYSNLYIIDLSKEMRQLELINSALLESRRHEKNFFLRGEKTYIDKTYAWQKRMLDLIKTEKAILPHSTQESWDKLERYSNEYIQGFRKDAQTKDAKGLQSNNEDTITVRSARALHTLLDGMLADQALRLDRSTFYLKVALIFLVFFSILIAADVTFAITRSITTSLQQGISFAKAIGDGNLAATLNHTREDEIGMLLISLDAMRDSLKTVGEKNLRNQMFQITMNALWESSSATTSFQKQLDLALQNILSLPWLKAEDKGAIFLVDEKKPQLIMVAQHGLSAPILQSCARVPLGHCLCGKALASQQIVFAHHVDEQHTISYPDMPPHGHYCVPLLSQQKLIGVLTFYLTTGHPWSDEEATFLTLLSNALASIIERKRLEAKLQHLAHHDILTGIPNRVLFSEHLRHAITTAIRREELMAVMLIDLDKFKQINDSMGHGAGDQLLIMVTERIKLCLRSSDLVARLGGDEFVVIVQNILDRQDAGLIADKIIQNLCVPFEIEGKICQIGASIGIAVFPEHRDQEDILLLHADTAMYAVKENGRNHYRYYQAPNVFN